MQKKWILWSFIVAVGVGMAVPLMIPMPTLLWQHRIERQDKPMKMKKRFIKIGFHSFGVEVARTKEEREYGLMFRSKLPQNTGMIFLNEAPYPMGVWMKNTWVSLDVLFFDEQKKIIKIFENLEPLDETPHRTAKPALGMLELPAGTVKKYKIKVGDEILY